MSEWKGGGASVGDSCSQGGSQRRWLPEGLESLDHQKHPKQDACIRVVPYEPLNTEHDQQGDCEDQAEHCAAYRRCPAASDA